jgi:hypothetical protein
MQVRCRVGQQKLLLDLGGTDFEKNTDLSKITIDQAVTTAETKAIEGHVYLERVRDGANDYCVLFQIVAIDSEGRYMAYIWRELPGGKQ